MVLQGFQNCKGRNRFREAEYPLFVFYSENRWFPGLNGYGSEKDFNSRFFNYFRDEIKVPMETPL